MVAKMLQARPGNSLPTTNRLIADLHSIRHRSAGLGPATASVCFVYIEGRCANFDCRALGFICKQFAAALNSSPQPRIVVDLREVGNFGTALINILLQTTRQVHAQGGELVFVGPVGDASEVLRITRLDQVWSVFDTAEGALAALQGSTA